MQNKTNALVIYDNKLNASLVGLAKKDYDIFMVCAYKLKDMRNTTIKISYAELISLGNKTVTINLVKSVQSCTEV